MNTFLKDLRFGARMLLKNPGFTLIAVLTIALGIGANTTIFSFVNGILLRPLPYKNADRLVVPISFNVTRGSDDGSSITYADYLDWKNEDVFEQVAAMDLLNSADLTGGDGEPERVDVAAVSEDYFSVLGSNALLGRTFLAEDYNPPGPARALIITYGLWQKRFGADPNIIGQKIYLNGRPYPVVGVMPRDSTYPTDREVLAPLAIGPNPGPNEMRRDNMMYSGIALGATSTDVLRLVLAQGLKLTLIGVGIGAGAAVGLTRFMAALLYQVSATDAVTFVVVSLLLTGVALAACFVPARRATRVDPIETLRYE